MAKSQGHRPLLWTAIEAAAATGGRLHGSTDWGFAGITQDTREIEPGDLFVALTGQRDGHDFLHEATARGASAALVSRVPDTAPADLPLLVVGDTMLGLDALALAGRQRHFGKRIAVTGSAGKTSTKDMLRSMLSEAGGVHAAKRSFNNHIGVPMTLAALPTKVPYGVFEIGMNHAGEITPLVGFVKPHAAIITTVGVAHLEFFDSVEGIAEAKAEILTGLAPGGTAVLPADNAHLALLKQRAAENGVQNVLLFGETAEGPLDARLLSAEARPEGGMVVTAEILGERMTFTMGAEGRHQALNALAALLAARAVGAPLDEILHGLSTFVPGDGRGATHAINLSGKRVQVLDESYNANPASMEASIALLAARAKATGGRAVAVLGAMKELGPDSPVLHRALAAPLKAAGVGLVFTAGKEMTALADALPPGVHQGHADEAIDLEDQIISTVQEGDVLLLKGSNASRVGALVAALKAPSGVQEQ